MHRGTIVMVCLEGTVRYLEYDWVATKGGLILEVPGESHTLVTEHPDGCKLFGWMQGPIEFYDDIHAEPATHSAPEHDWGHRAPPQYNASRLTRRISLGFPLDLFVIPEDVLINSFRIP